MLNFLREGGLGLPKEVELGMVLLSLLGAYLYAYHKKWGPWKSATLVMVVFIIVYPKMHIGYYLMPMMLLLVWAADDWKIASRLFLAFIPLSQAVGFLPGGDGLVQGYEQYNWFFGFVLALAGTLLFVDAMKVAFKTRSFIQE
jgi:hypothetical protein